MAPLFAPRHRRSYPASLLLPPTSPSPLPTLVLLVVLHLLLLPLLFSLVLLQIFLSPVTWAAYIIFGNRVAHAASQRRRYNTSGWGYRSFPRTGAEQAKVESSEMKSDTRRTILDTEDAPSMDVDTPSIAEAAARHDLAEVHNTPSSFSMVNIADLCSLPPSELPTPLSRSRTLQFSSQPSQSFLEQSASQHIYPPSRIISVLPPVQPAQPAQPTAYDGPGAHKLGHHARPYWVRSFSERLRIEERQREWVGQGGPAPGWTSPGRTPRGSGQGERDISWRELD